MREEDTPLDHSPRERERAAAAAAWEWSQTWSAGTRSRPATTSTRGERATSTPTTAGIYIGDGAVIHFTRSGAQEIGNGTFLDRLFASSMPSRGEIPCEDCGDQSSLEGVIISCLDCFLSGGELYRFRYAVSPAFFLAKLRGGTCTLARSDPPAAVLHRAEYLLQHGFGSYNLFERNCEDFAIYCKTGLLVIAGSSGQWVSIKCAVRAFASAPLSLRCLTTGFCGVTAITGGVTVITGGLYCANRVTSDIGVRRDTVKVPVENLVDLLEHKILP